MSLKILLADDSMTAQRMGKKILTEAGFHVVVASNGAVAMKKIASEKPDLLLLDIFMPGYSGLEICEKVKSAPETARLPVLLTVGQMEPFRPEDGNKVKADGVIIKPFEAQDLTAAVQKLVDKLAPPPKAGPAHEKTQRMSVPVEQESQDASYEEQKTAADNAAAISNRISVPQDMAGAAAFDMDEPQAATAAAGSGMDEMQVQASSWASPSSGSGSPWASEAVTAALEQGTATPAWSDTTKPVEAEWAPSAPAWDAPTPETPSGVDAEPAAESAVGLPDLALGTPDLADAKPDQSVASSDFAVAEPEPATESGEHSTDTYDINDLRAASAATPGTTLPELEATSAPKAGVVEIIREPGLEVTHADAGEVHAAADPALLTDPTQMVSEFATKFGAENPEPVPMGVADHMAADPMLEAEEVASESVVAAEAAPTWTDTPAPASARAVPEAAAEVEVPVEPPSTPAPEISSSGNEGFAAALNSAISGVPVAVPEPVQAPAEATPPPAEPAPVETQSAASSPNADHEVVTRAVERVLERFKGDIVAEIMRELRR